MASSGKKKTTMAKLTRESRLRERRLDKQARKDARKLAPASADTIDAFGEEPTQGPAEPAREPVTQTVADTGSALAG